MSYYKTSSFSYTLAIQLIFSCLLLLLPFSNSFDVRLYEHRQFEGKYTKIKLADYVMTCVNLTPTWEKAVMSIDAVDCIVVYAEKDCRGLRRRLDKWSWGCADLKEISFDNRLTSLSPCPKERKQLVEEEL